MSSPLLNTPSFAATTVPDSKATKVLLVEDNESDALLVREALAGLRDRNLCGSIFEIHTTEHLSAARARLSEEHFDVILLDLSLPDSKSHEDSFLQIREHASGIPIIVLTGVDDETLGLRMVRDGAQDYLIITISALRWRFRIISTRGPAVGRSPPIFAVGVSWAED